jgi:hypothetical protein
MEAHAAVYERSGPDAEEKPWAAVYVEEWPVDGVMRRKQRLVVVYAPSAAEAAEASGMVLEQFHEATDDELDEWQEAADEPLSPREVRTLIGMVTRAQRGIGSKRRKSARRHRHDNDRPLARRYALLLRKLELMLDDDEIKEAA